MKVSQDVPVQPAVANIADTTTRDDDSPTVAMMRQPDTEGSIRGQYCFRNKDSLLFHSQYHRNGTWTLLPNGLKTSVDVASACS